MLKKSLAASFAALALTAGVANATPQLILTLPAQRGDPERTALVTVNNGAVTIQTEGKSNTLACNDYLETLVSVVTDRNDDFRNAVDYAKDTKTKVTPEVKKEFTDFVKPVLAVASFAVTECVKTPKSLYAETKGSVEKVQADFKTLAGPR